MCFHLSALTLRVNVIFVWGEFCVKLYLFLFTKDTTYNYTWSNTIAALVSVRVSAKVADTAI